jgi:FMP27, sixth RBG unit/Fmp27, SW motif RBG repeat/Fmp27/BLTP2/Hobbit, GFWDK motif-containg RBG unit
VVLSLHQHLLFIVSQSPRFRYDASSPPGSFRLTLTLQPFTTVVKSVALRFPSINVVHSSSKPNTPNECNYLYTVENVDLRLSLSNPSTNQLHRKWLGSGSHSPLDGSVYGLVWNIGFVTVSRLSVTEAPFRLLALHKLEMNLLAYQWPPTPSTAPRLLSGDLNGPFVACEMSLIGLHMTERVEELRANIDSVIPEKRTRSPALELVPTVLSKFPRLELLIECNDIRTCLTACDTESAHTTRLLILRTPGFHASLSTAFSPDNKKAVWERSPQSHGGVHMDTTCYTFLHPIFVRVGLARGVKDNTGHEWDEDSGEPDPLLGIDGLELSITCTTPGHIEVNDAIILEPFDSVLDIKCVFDDMFVELWKDETIATMLIFVGVVRSQRNVKPAVSNSTILDRLCPGVSLHLGIGRLSCAITGPDVNPLCGLELSRGLEVCTGVSIRCCYMRKYHSQRPRPLSAQDRDRSQLGLLEDLRMHAPIARGDSGPLELSALFQCVTWQSTCRNITSTRYEYSADDPGIRRENEDYFISMPRTFTTAHLRRQKQSVLVVDMSIHDTCDVFVNIPHIRSRLDLHNLYSALLALHTLHLFSPRHPHSNPLGIHKTASIRTTFRLRLANVHVFCHLPLHERLFIRVLSATFEQSPDIPFKTECNSLVAWVSNVHVEGKWEELSRLYGANVIVTRGLPRVKVAVSAEGFRITIPHGYILSRLILDATIAMKTLRHLHRIVPLGYFIPLEPPGGEAPKNLPDFDIFIRSTTLEAADSPFEAKLGLIWRAGFQAQKMRTERELAFEAKLHAILASGDSQVSLDSAPQSDLRYRFTSKRTTSLADARVRLNMVHSNSWIRSISHQKAEIARKEDTILRQLRHAMNINGYHVPLPISVHTSEKAPPLFRAVINGVSITLAPPCFPAGYQGFLSDLGDMPLSTEYTLLLPMHLQCSLGAAMMNIRDYPLPFLNVPFHADGPSVEFDMDLIIAEEVGSTDSVEWFQCPIVSHNAGIVGASAFVVQVPKTIMPVKSYANPGINFRTKSVTEFTWGVSYNPAIQEIMRVVSSLSSLDVPVPYTKHGF